MLKSYLSNLSVLSVAVCNDYSYDFDQIDRNSLATVAGLLTEAKVVGQS